MTKKTLFYCSRKEESAAEAAQAFIDNFICEYGLPDKIISDRDSRFTSLLWIELAKRLKVRLGMSTAFHPQTDGQTERINRVIIEMLRTMGAAYRDTWARKIKLIQFNINNSVSTVTGMKPFVAFAAFEPRVIDTLALEQSNMQSLKDLAGEMAEITSRVQDEITRAQQQMYKTTAEVIPTTFTEGEYVLVSTAHFETFVSRAIKSNRKLGPKFIGPFRIKKMVNPSAAKLELPPDYRMHPTINKTYLRKFIFDEYDRDVPQEPEIIKDELHYHVDYIVAEATRDLGREAKIIGRSTNS